MRRLLSVDIRKQRDGLRVELACEIRIDAPSCVILEGPSGGGKSTALRCLAGLERPDAGTIRCGDEVWFDGDGDGLSPQQRRVGFVAQDDVLFPHLNVAQNLLFAQPSCSRIEAQQQVARMLELLALRGKHGRFPRELSGGERQRVLLGRAILRRPRIMLLDEPFSALDQKTRAHIRSMLRAWMHRENVPAIMVTHEGRGAWEDPDLVLRVDDGTFRQTIP